MPILALALAAAVGPAGAAFYQPPVPLAPAMHGDVIWSRPWTAGAAPAGAAINTLVLYHTVGPDGRDVAVSGTVSIPKGDPPKGGWPVISWTHGTSGNGPLCAPSRYEKPEGEQVLMSAFVDAGYAVVQTDYEGNGTPGIHPYFVMQQYAHDAGDMVRAARQLYPAIGSRWLVMGHSEGGAASIGVAAYAQAWVPELQLLGSVAYAPGSHEYGLLQDMKQSQQPSLFLIFFALMVQGQATADPAVRPDELFYPNFTSKFPDLQRRCFRQIDKDFGWMSLVPSEVFRRGADTTALERDLIANDPGGLHVSVPSLVVQGTIDDEVGVVGTTQLVGALCARGADVQYQIYDGKDHFTAMAASLARSERWVADRFASIPATSACGLPPPHY